MNPDQRILVVGIYLSGMLYLTGCFVVSLFVNHGIGWQFALVSVGACYCAYSAQVMFAEARRVAVGFVIVSQGFGFCAGVAALLGG